MNQRRGEELPAYPNPAAVQFIHPLPLPVNWSKFFLPEWGRTGLDLRFEIQAACRGRLVGLVKNRVKKITAETNDLALAA